MALAFILDAPGGPRLPRAAQPRAAQPRAAQPRDASEPGFDFPQGPVRTGYQPGSGQYSDPIVELARALVARHNSAQPLPLPYVPVWGDDSYVSPQEQQARIQRGRHIPVFDQGPAPIPAHGPLQSGAPRTSTNAGRIQDRRSEGTDYYQTPLVHPIPDPQLKNVRDSTIGAQYLTILLARMLAHGIVQNADANGDPNRPQGGSLFPPGYVPPGTQPPPLPPGMYPTGRP